MCPLERAATQPDVRTVALPGWEREEASWSRLPPFRCHVLLCQGPRCATRGAGDLWAHFEARLQTEGLRPDEEILVTRTGCLFPCNRGPVMVVYPSATWYGALSEEAVTQVVAEHLKQGTPLLPHIITPGHEAQRRPRIAACPVANSLAINKE
jgi:(2Fe-2S) ferredoxin